MFCKSGISIVILYFCLHFVHPAVNVKDVESSLLNGNKEWDYLLFTQHWPTTFCKQWIHKNPNNSCVFPKKKDIWTVHGTWPTKKGTRGPEFCNSTWLFDPEAIRPIEDELNQSWINVEKGTSTYDFWAHEWNKHGTCAAEIEAFDSEFKYFNKGLEFLGKYEMADILQKANIYPSDTKPLKIDEINKAIVSGIGKTPIINCKYDQHVQYLFEVSICLDKELNVIDCNELLHPNLNLKYVDGAVTYCNVHADIIYPEQLPPKMELVQLYKFTNWLQWLTL